MLYSILDDVADFAPIDDDASTPIQLGGGSPTHARSQWEGIGDREVFSTQLIGGSLTHCRRSLTALKTSLLVDH